MPTMPDDTINGIPRIDPLTPHSRWQKVLQTVVASKAGAAVHRTVFARLDEPVMRLTGGRVNLGLGVAPIVVLTTTGARSGKRRESPLIYFTDGDDVVVIASNYGGAKHPAWYHNLTAHPECELHIGEHGGRFTAHEATGADRDRLFELATDVYKGYADYAQRVGDSRTIRVMRLTPAG